MLRVNNNNNNNNKKRKKELTFPKKSSTSSVRLHNQTRVDGYCSSFLLVWAAIEVPDNVVNLLARRVEATVRQVVHERVVEEHTVLGNDTHVAPQGLEFHVSNVLRGRGGKTCREIHITERSVQTREYKTNLPIDQNATLLRVHKAKE
jgi:hypothetical protein